MQVSVTNILQYLLILFHCRFWCTVELRPGRSILQLSLSLSSLVMNLPKHINNVAVLHTFCDLGSNSREWSWLLKLSTWNCSDWVDLHTTAWVLRAVWDSGTYPLRRTLEMASCPDYWCTWDILISEHSWHGFFNCNAMIKLIDLLLCIVLPSIWLGVIPRVLLNVEMAAPPPYYCTSWYSLFYPVLGRVVC